MRQAEIDRREKKIFLIAQSHIRRWLSLKDTKEILHQGECLVAHLDASVAEIDRLEDN